MLRTRSSALAASGDDGFGQMRLEGLRQQSDAGHVSAHAIVQLAGDVAALLGLAFGQAPLQPPAIAEIAKDAGEARRWSIWLIARSSGNVVPSLRWPTNSRPTPMMRASPVLQVASDVAVVLVAIRLGHQQPDVLADDLGRGISEHLLGGEIERLDRAVLIDRDDRVDGRVDDRPQVVFAPA